MFYLTVLYTSLPPLYLWLYSFLLRANAGDINTFYLAAGESFQISGKRRWRQHTEQNDRLEPRWLAGGSKREWWGKRREEGERGDGFKGRLSVLEKQAKRFTKQMLHIYQEWKCLFLPLLLQIFNYRAHQSTGQSSISSAHLCSAKKPHSCLKSQMLKADFQTDDKLGWKKPGAAVLKETNWESFCQKKKKQMEKRGSKKKKKKKVTLRAL